jgi:hypothetical protein
MCMLTKHVKCANMCENKTGGFGVTNFALFHLSDHLVSKKAASVEI